MISASQRPLPDNTQHSQQTDIHVPGGIRTHNLSRRAAVDLRLRPRGTGTGTIIYGCLTRYRTRHLFNNSNANEDTATKFEQEYVRCVRNEDGCVCSAPNCCDTEQRSASQPASFRRDFGHRARPIWRRLIISYGDIWNGEFTKTNHET